MALLFSTGAAAPITAGQARLLVQENLVYHAPSFGLSLDQLVNADGGGDDLVGAGVLTAARTQGRVCGEPLARYRLSQDGLRIAGQRGWATEINSLAIPVGRFIYVPGTYAVRRGALGSYEITFRFRYVGNSNSRYLLSIGKASDWATGDGLSLANLGEVLTETVPLVETRGKWRIGLWHAFSANNRCGVM